jgi:hypothetical protein
VSIEICCWMLLLGGAALWGVGWLHMRALVQPDWDMFQSAHPAGRGTSAEMRYVVLCAG